MRSETSPSIGVIDALTSGLNHAARRPWLLIIPVLVDTALWLAPRLSIGLLLKRLLAAWEALLPLAYTPTQIASLKEMLDLARTAIGQVGEQISLASLLTAAWLAPPSALAAPQATRLTLISDGVLAQVGLGLNLARVAAPSWRPPAIEISSIAVALLVAVILWLAGHLVVALYLRLSALALPEPFGVAAHAGSSPSPGAQTKSQAHASPGLLRLTFRIAVLSLLLGIVVLLLRLPLALVTSLTVLTGSAGAGALFVLSGGITLWLMLSFLCALFFAGDAMVLGGQPLWPSIWQSMVLVRSSGIKTLGLAALVNLLMLGSRAIWGLIGGTPLGALAAVLGNAYLATSMLLAVFIYYGNLRRQWQLKAQGRAAKQERNE